MGVTVMEIVILLLIWLCVKNILSPAGDRLNIESYRHYGAIKSTLQQIPSLN
jgi:hypothetical protein